jgi:hypothetical protein
MPRSPILVSRSATPPLPSCLLAGAALLLLGLSAPAHAQGETPTKKVEPVKSVAELVERMKVAESSFDNVRAEIEMTQIVDMTGRFEGGKKLDMKARVAFEILRRDAAPGARPDGEGAAGEERRSFARMRSASQGPGGLSKLTVVRNDQGAFIHEANETSGQRWLHVPADLLERLAKAERVLGGSGSQAVQRIELGSFLGAELIEGLAGAYELSLDAPVQIAGADCEHVVGKLKREGQSSGLLGRGRPDRVDLYIDRSNFLMRRMVHSLAGQALLTVELLGLDLAAKLKAADFVLEAKGGAQFEDIRKDPVANASIRDVLRRLEEWEQKQEEAETKAGEASGEAKKEGGSEGEPKNKAKKKEGGDGK